MELIASLLAGGYSFLHTVWGMVVRPYETYRKIVARGSFWELPYIALVLAVYFSTASLVRTSAFRPYLLTKQFVFLGGAAGGSFLLAFGTLWLLGRVVGGIGQPGRLLLTWAYTLIPTTLWFFMTSVLFVILPPPRTESWKGVAFSLLYLICTITLLWWKIMLYYLSLRFSLRLDLPKILLVTLCAIPLFAVYSLAMYRLGIFRIPFL